MDIAPFNPYIADRLSFEKWGASMKWVTQDHVNVDRTACLWLIRKHIDSAAEFRFVPADQVLEVAARDHALAFDVAGAELNGDQWKSTFEVLVSKYHIQDPAIGLLGRIVHGAGLDEDRDKPPEAHRLKAIAESIGQLTFQDMNKALRKLAVVYDALYVYCRTTTLSSSPSQPGQAAKNPHFPEEAGSDRPQEAR